jgi:hypothetical protein
LASRLSVVYMPRGRTSKLKTGRVKVVAILFQISPPASLDTDSYSARYIALLTVGRLAGRREVWHV